VATDYPNRSDLRNPMQQAKFTGQTYGQATQQAQSQQAVPSGAAPTDIVPMPGQVADLAGPTQRPNEPTTAGMNFGPGPNADVFGPSRQPTQPMPQEVLGGSRQYIIDQVRSLYSRHPNSALFQLILELENQPL
jgi:hypothetical protein